MSIFPTSIEQKIEAAVNGLTEIGKELLPTTPGRACIYLTLADAIKSHSTAREGETFTFSIPPGWLIDVQGQAISAMQGPATLKLFLENKSTRDSSPKKGGTQN